MQSHIDNIVLHNHNGTGLLKGMQYHIVIKVNMTHARCKRSAVGLNKIHRCRVGNNAEQSGKLL